MKIVAIMFVFYVGAAFGSVRCPNNDISKVDIKSLEIDDANTGAMSLKFNNGVATAKIDSHQNTAEWEYTVKKDEYVTLWTAPKKLRVLTINKNHLRGSGNSNLFVVLSCENSQLKVIWQMTEINSIEITDGNIAYETLGKYGGAQAPGPGKRFILEWNSERKVLVKRDDCPPPYQPLQKLCRNIKFRDAPPELKAILGKANCSVDDNEDGYKFELNEKGETAYNLCCHSPPHGPCSSRIWAKLDGSWKDFTSDGGSELNIFGDKNEIHCPNFYLLAEKHNGYHSFCQSNTVFKFINGKYVTEQ